MSPTLTVVLNSSLPAFALRPFFDINARIRDLTNGKFTYQRNLHLEVANPRQAIMVLKDVDSDQELTPELIRVLEIGLGADSSQLEWELHRSEAGVLYCDSCSVVSRWAAIPHPMDHSTQWMRDHQGHALISHPE